MDMIPYENITRLAYGQAPRLAKEIIIKGWSRRGYPPIYLDNIPWTINDKSFRSWNFYIHSWDMLDALLQGYWEVNDRSFLVKSADVALSWSEHYKLPAGAASGPSMAWYDMAVGLRVYRLAYLIDAIDSIGLLNNQQRGHLWSCLLDHLKYLEDDQNFAFHNNHGYFQAAGQIAAGRRFYNQCNEAVVAFELGKARLRQMLQQQFGSDGVHKEHSPDYHRMVYETLRALIDAGLVDDEEALAAANRIEKALSWFVLPDQRIANFGDSDYRFMWRKPEEALRKWQTPQMQYVVSGGAVGNAPETNLAVFEEGGFYVVRKHDAYLAQIAAFHSRTHKHADDLSLIWSDKGSSILVDAGRYGYIGKTEQGSELWLDGHWYSDPKRIYCESTRAHNTLEIDGKNQPRRGVKPYGSAIGRWIEHESGLYALESESKYFGSIRHARVLLFMPGNWLIVFDWFHDNNKEHHDVRQWFHLAPSLKLEKHDVGFKSCLPNGELLQVMPLLDDAAASDLYSGEGQPRLQGWWSPKERELVPNYAFCYEQRDVPNGVFASLFDFTKSLKPDYHRSRANASGRKAQFVWNDDSGVHTVRLERPIDGPMEVFYEHK